jgi:UDP-N-acetylmuramyl pentapeptide phosphotransferase/UDP-N-acetylglucosamine-1-phosphate transferase
MMDYLISTLVAAFPSTPQLLLTLLSPLLTFLLTCSMIPRITPYFLKARMFGLDLGKKGTSTESVQVPEAAGLVAGTVFLLFLLAVSASQPPSLPLISSLFSILFMMFLGFTDDVLDWPWRYKLVLPLLGCIPVCSCYSGSTSILLPSPVRHIVYASPLSSPLQALLEFVGVVLDPTSPHGLVDLNWLYVIEPAPYPARAPRLTPRAQVLRIHLPPVHLHDQRD